MLVFQKISIVRYEGMCILLVWVLFGIILLIIALNDFLFFRIEDEPVCALFGLYLVSCFCGILGNDILYTLAVAIAIFLVTLALNHLNLIGGGDVKLIFPLILLAEGQLSTFLVGVSFGGVILSLTYVLFGQYIFIFRKKIVTQLLNFRKKRKKIFLLNIVLLSLSRISHRSAVLTYHVTSVWRQEIPYGVALAYGGFCVILENLLSR